MIDQSNSRPAGGGKKKAIPYKKLIESGDNLFLALTKKHDANVDQFIKHTALLYNRYISEAQKQADTLGIKVTFKDFIRID